MRLKLNVGSEIQIDEMEYRTKGKQSWFVDIIDTKTRFVVYSNYVKSREKKQFKDMFRIINSKTNGNIKKVTTDGFKLYTNIVKKSFGYNNKLGEYNVKHNVVNASTEEEFNHPIERLHNTIRERTKTMRSFGSFNGAEGKFKDIFKWYLIIGKEEELS